MKIESRQVGVTLIKRNIEIWKPIKKWPGYAISNMGRVRSLRRLIETRKSVFRLIEEKILKSSSGSNGYFHIDLSLKNKTKTISIHSLVINHFGKPKPTPKHECNHRDGIKSNNWDTNLEWLTKQQNIQHAFDNGLNDASLGQNHHLSKLTEDQVKYIRRIYSAGLYSYTEISRKFKLSISCIRCIVNFKTWKHVKEVS